jgi:hypothetical protein
VVVVLRLLRPSLAREGACDGLGGPLALLPLQVLQVLLLSESVSASLILTTVCLFPEVGKCAPPSLPGGWEAAGSRSVESSPPWPSTKTPQTSLTKFFDVDVFAGTRFGTSAGRKGSCSVTESPCVVDCVGDDGERSAEIK